MKDEEFNRYCAEVMGYSFYKYGDLTNTAYVSTVDNGVIAKRYTDLNQMADVFDELWPDSMEESSSLITDINEEFFLENLACKGIAKAMREFIESTAPLGEVR